MKSTEVVTGIVNCNYGKLKQCVCVCEKERERESDIINMLAYSKFKSYSQQTKIKERNFLVVWPCILYHHAI
jgi:hypothetical protein